jgi:hypothetical protein
MRVPQFKEPGLTKFLEDLDNDLRRAQIFNVNSRTARDSALLQSPSGKVYAVKVDDAGVISTTLVAG